MSKTRLQKLFPVNKLFSSAHTPTRTKTVTLHVTVALGSTKKTLNGSLHEIQGADKLSPVHIGGRGVSLRRSV